MPTNSKIIFALSLCRKAGALVMGFDAVKESVYKGKAVLVLCAGDVSDGTRRRVENFCDDLVEVIFLPDTQEQLWQICKKPTGVFAVTDEQLAVLCKNSTSDTSTENKEESPCR